MVETMHRFTLYRIFSLPEPKEEEWAVRVVGLLAFFFAILGRQDHYIYRFWNYRFLKQQTVQKWGFGSVDSTLESDGAVSASPAL